MAAGSPHGPDHNAIWARSLELDGDPSEVAGLYADWAATYDADVAAEGYGLPNTMVAVLQAAAAHDDSTAWASDPGIEILDAGCGTGLVGMALAAAGYTTVDGIDISPEMTAHAAERGVYRQLDAPVDLTATPPASLLQSAAVVMVGGVFTVGHIPAETLDNVASLVKPGGLLITSVRPAYYDSSGYQAVSDRLEAAGVLETLVRFDAAPYTVDTTGHYWAYRVG